MAAEKKAPAFSFTTFQNPFEPENLVSRYMLLLLDVRHGPGRENGGAGIIFDLAQADLAM
jgi:hypothetical protein